MPSGVFQQGGPFTSFSPSYLQGMADLLDEGSDCGSDVLSGSSHSSSRASASTVLIGDLPSLLINGDITLMSIFSLLHSSGKVVHLDSTETGLSTAPILEAASPLEESQMSISSLTPKDSQEASRWPRTAARACRERCKRATAACLGQPAPSL